MASERKKGPESSKQKEPSQEEIFRKFQSLRNEQREFVLKISEIEVELSEHRMVIDTLQDMDGDRRCYRKIGGVLCEQTVKDVLPALVVKRDQLQQISEAYNEKLTKKGQEINEYMELHNIRVKGQEDPPPKADGDSKDKGSTSTQKKGLMIEPV